MKKRISAEVFVKTWQSSKNLSEVSTRTGIAKLVASTKAAQFRARGVRLKKFTREDPRKLNVEALNEIATRALKAG